MEKNHFLFPEKELFVVLSCEFQSDIFISASCVVS